MEFYAVGYAGFGPNVNRTQPKRYPFKYLALPSWPAETSTFLNPVSEIRPAEGPVDLFELGSGSRLGTRVFARTSCLTTTSLPCSCTTPMRNNSASGTSQSGYPLQPLSSLSGRCPWRGEDSRHGICGEPAGGLFGGRASGARVRPRFPFGDRPRQCRPVSLECSLNGSVALTI